MQITPHHIHVWLINLAISRDQANYQYGFLSVDEQARADRFHQPIHRIRFIAARYALRKIVSGYVGIPLSDIIFFYNAHGKPSVKLKKTSLQFNLSHSHDVAICALSLNHPVGIDLEKMKEKDYLSIAKRFFSDQENHMLVEAPVDERKMGFYRIWSRKEALLKAIGKGLSLPLNSFSVSMEAIPEKIVLEDKTWSLVSLDILPEYQAALASSQEIKQIQRFSLTLPT